MNPCCYELNPTHNTQCKSHNAAALKRVKTVSQKYIDPRRQEKRRIRQGNQVASDLNADHRIIHDIKKKEKNKQMTNTNENGIKK